MTREKDPIQQLHDAVDRLDEATRPDAPLHHLSDGFRPLVAALRSWVDDEARRRDTDHAVGATYTSPDGQTITIDQGWIAVPSITQDGQIPLDADLAGWIRRRLDDLYLGNRQETP